MMLNSLFPDNELTFTSSGSSLLWPSQNFCSPLARNATDFLAGFSTSCIMRGLLHLLRSIVMPLDTCFDDEDDDDDDDDDQPRIMYHPANAAYSLSPISSLSFSVIEDAGSRPRPRRRRRALVWLWDCDAVQEQPVRPWTVYVTTFRSSDHRAGAGLAELSNEPFSAIASSEPQPCHRFPPTISAGGGGRLPRRPF